MDDQGKGFTVMLVLVLLIQIVVFLLVNVQVQVIAMRVYNVMHMIILFMGIVMDR